MGRLGKKLLTKSVYKTKLKDKSLWRVRVSKSWNMLSIQLRAAKVICQDVDLWKAMMKCVNVIMLAYSLTKLVFFLTQSGLGVGTVVKANFVP